MRWTTTGAKPRDSSSSSSTRGLATSARPMATDCCSPPDSCAVRWARRPVIQSNSSYTRSIVHGPFRAYVAPIWRFSSTVSDPNNRRPSGTMAIPRVARRSGRTLVTSWPSYRIDPSVGSCRPAIVRSSVDLPAPFAPMMAYTSPGNTRSDT